MLLDQKLKHCHGDGGYQTYLYKPTTCYVLYLSPITVMSSQQSNERRPNRPLSHITLHARQLLRVNTQRAVNWFRKPSFPRFKIKISSRSSRSSPYSHSSSRDDASIKTSSTATLHSIEPIRRRAPQTASAYNTRMIRTSPVIVPVMPTVCCLLFFTVLEADQLVLSLVLDLVSLSPINVNFKFGHGLLGSVHLAILNLRSISLTIAITSRNLLHCITYINYTHTSVLPVIHVF